MLNFTPITMDRQHAYGERLAMCSLQTSDYSFVNLWGWKEEYGLSWAWTDELVWIKQSMPEERWWGPVGRWQDRDWKKIFDLDVPRGTTFSRIPEDVALLWQRDMETGLVIEEARGDWDYIYDVQALVTLSGNRYHKKKNLLNQFCRKYEYRYVPFTADMVKAALDMQENWCTWRDCESSDTLAAENRVIERVLGAWQDLSGIMGGALFVDHRMVAYTIAEVLPVGTLLIHFEKADPDFRGAYQAINQMFLAQLGDTPPVTVNREQDLGDDGLRKAKLSYHPAFFLKKYQIKIF